MGTCSYCGTSAGLFRAYHPECKYAYDRGKKEMVLRATMAIKSGENLDGLEANMKALAVRARVPQDEVRAAMIAAWGNVLEDFLSDDGPISPEEESRLVKAKERLGLSQDELEVNGNYSKLVKATVLRGIEKGEIPPLAMREGDLPFNFEKSEALVWHFGGCAYFQERVRRSRVGGYSGLSVRVAKGVSWHLGAFESHPVEVAGMEAVDSGDAAITSRHIYFAGSRASWRVPYAKIVSLVPYRDALGFFRDATNAKQQVLVTGDGWFTYNLVANLAKLDS